MLHCEGRSSIQDYKPRHYGFSFGYECRISVKPSLVGLLYNFTISGQSNKTQCLGTPQNLSEINCTGFYDYMSLPNMIGDPDVVSVEKWASGFKKYGAFVAYVLSHLPTGGCYKYMKELFCRIVLPQCDPVENQVIPLCKETIRDVLHGCLKPVEAFIEVLSSSSTLKLFNQWTTLVDRNISADVDSDYLPSINDPIPCFYKPVTCDLPPNVTNARIIDGTESNGTYLAMSQVDYKCLDETFQIEGNSTVTCLYSGKWYKLKLPECWKNKPTLNPLRIVIPLLIAPFFLFIIAHSVRRYICMRKKVLLLKRKREYDAFVCYNFDEDNDFVLDSILPQLEEKHDPPLKMLTHDRNFELGQLITTNMHNAIKNCNSAIIVMSQGFVNSPICREEFTKCLRENEKDPAFKLFIIMMKEVDTLVNVPENMQNYFKEKTYVKKDLFEKIGKHLKLMRQHDVMDDNIELEHLIENHDEA